MASTSTRPYLIRALHEWCTDNGLTPYLSVFVDDSVQVPRDYVRDDQIVLNVSFDATSGLQFGDDFISFKARFGGVPRDLMVPVDRVMAIYARENGEGMSFPIELQATAEGDDGAQPQDDAQASRPMRLVDADAADGEPGDAARDRADTAPAVGAQPASAAARPSEPPPEGGAPVPGGARRPALKRVK